MMTAAGPLSLLGPLYRAAVAARGALYDAGWLRAARLPVPVVSVGNLTVGGTGKSPMVELVASRLSSGGFAPAIVSRGYGGTHRGAATVVSEGGGPLVAAEVAGDEPVMLAAALPGVPVIVSRRRRDGGEMAIRRYGARCIVLDDGFQHRALARDLDLLLLDGGDPFGGGRLLPAGILREPVSAMARAGAVVITRADMGGEAALLAIAHAAARHCPEAPIFHARSRAVGLIEAGGGELLPLERLRGARAVCFAGIARPERFFEDAEREGASVVERLVWPDHHRYATTDLERIDAAARRAGADLILTTQKDLARLAARDGAPRLRGLHALRIVTAVEEEDRFVSLLNRALS